MPRLPITTESVTFSFQPEAGSLPKDVQVAYSHVSTNEGSPIDTLGVLGLGNEGNAATRAAQLAGSLGVYGVAFAGALPYWRANPTEDGIRRLACESTAAIANDIAQKHEPKLLHAFGESQGGPAVLESAASQTAQITGNIALLRPLGFQGPLKVSAFVGRMLRTGMQLDQFSCPYSLAIAAHASRRFAKDATRHRGALFQYALGYSGVPALEQLITQNRSVTVIAATNDRVFPPNELRETLRGIIDITEIPGTHSTLASPAGARQLPDVMSICRTGMLPAKNHLEVR